MWVLRWWRALASFAIAWWLKNKETMMVLGRTNIVESAEAERLATGFVFTAGPLWHAAAPMA